MRGIILLVFAETLELPREVGFPMEGAWEGAFHGAVTDPGPQPLLGGWGTGKPEAAGR